MLITCLFKITQKGEPIEILKITRGNLY